ncbi:hypothetical protein [Sebaldella termitidis]|nr:hypothetical protein [Sebaldella termitidis]
MEQKVFCYYDIPSVVFILILFHILLSAVLLSAISVKGALDI